MKNKKADCHHLHASELHDHGLVVEQHLKPPLCYLSLVRSVWGVPRRVLQQPTLQHSWGDNAVVSLTYEAFYTALVQGDFGLKLRQCFLFGKGLPDLQLVGREQRNWDGGLDKALQR